MTSARINSIDDLPDGYAKRQLLAARDRGGYRDQCDDDAGPATLPPPPPPGNRPAPPPFPEGADTAADNTDNIPF